MNLKSIRWRLPLSYALIALLATLLLGTILIVTLRDYYGQRERLYLENNALAIQSSLASSLESGMPPSILQSQVNSLAFFAQTRLQVFGPAGEVLADSGDPARRDVLAFSPYNGQDVRVMRAQAGSEAVGDAGGLGAFVQRAEPYPVEGSTTVTEVVTSSLPAERPMLVQVSMGPAMPAVAAQAGGEDQVFFYSSEVMTAPMSGVGAFTFPISHEQTGVVNTISVAGDFFGFAFTSEVNTSPRRSSVTLEKTLQTPAGKPLGKVVISDGPAYGQDIVGNVTRLWAVAGLAAVLLAASAGWWISRQLTQPLLALNTATQRMAGGDLSTRADDLGPDEFGHLGRSFNEMAEQVEETMLALRRFVSDAAHELHTPLTALRTDLDLAASEAEPEKRSRYLERAQSQVLRLNHLAMSLLDLSRVEAQAEGRQWVELDLAELVRLTSEPYAAQAEQAGQSFQLTCPAQPVQVHGSPGQLQRALANLLDNALKFTPPEGNIQVGLEMDGECVRLTIEDSGIGIPPEDLERLFERFHRASNAAAYPGSGLGLAIVRAIVTAHNGQVWAEPLPESGTRFVIELPALLAPPPSHTPENSPIRAPSARS